MKSILYIGLGLLAGLLFPEIGRAQAPSLGTAADFEIFTTVGGITNSGTSHITGNVGTNSGSITGFGNVNGQMHSGNGVTAQCAADLLIAYNSLDTTTADYFPAVLLGGGDTLIAGVYSYSASSTLSGDLYMDAEGDSNAVFILQIEGTFGSGANSRVILLNGTQACNVFWKIEGAVSMAAGTRMKGTMIVNNAAITMNANDTLEGRAMTTNGAITLDGVMAYTPVGCGSVALTGPTPPTLGDASCYAIFSSDGPVTNTGVSFATGDVGTNVGLTTGFDSLNVDGTIHPIPDTSTSSAAADLLLANTYLTGVTHDIELLYPAQFGQNLVLTPHSYLLNAGTALTDSLYLNAMGDSNAVFFIKINGALSTSTFAKVLLINGTLAKNVYWQVNGAVDISANSDIKGTIIAHNGAIDLNSGVNLDGRALTTTGALTTAAVTVAVPDPCGGIAPPNILTEPIGLTVCSSDSISLIVVAEGQGLTYQWRKGTTILVNGGNISGATSDTLTIDPVGPGDTSSFYNVIVSGTAAPNDTSINAALLLTPAPSISSISVDQTECIGDAATFIVNATGAGLSYQWRKGTVDLVNGGSISGATSDTLTIDPVAAIDASTSYKVMVSGTCAPIDTSSNVSLTVNAPPAITVSPNDQIECVGSTANFAVTATGANLTYQWRKGVVNLVNGGSISGATSSSLTISPVGTSNAATDYNMVVSGTCSPIASSSNASLTVNTLPTITTQPADQVECEGSPASFTVVATGTNASYQWRKGTVDLVNGGAVSGATSATLTIDPVQTSDASSQYNVVVSGTCVPAVTSSMVVLTVDSAVDILSSPPSVMECEGNAVQFSVDATGTGLTYQWRKGTVNLNNGGTISGATSSTLIIDPIVPNDASSNYNAVVTGTGVCSTSETTTPAILVVQIAPVITTEPVSKSVCSGSSANFTVAANGTGISYQWKIGETNLVNGGNISGAQSNTLTINPTSLADTSNSYNVLVNGTCTPNNSQLVELLVKTSPVIVEQPADQAAYTGSAVFFSTEATGDGLTYQWRRGTMNMTNGGNISGVNTDELMIDPLGMGDVDTNYNVVITGDCTPDVISQNAALKAVFPLGVDAEMDAVVNAVSIYPNPFRGSFTMHIDEASSLEQYDLVLYNALGKEVMQQQMVRRDITIDASHLVKGIYFYRVLDQGKTIQSGKLIAH